jgi:hypothetical protein
VLITLLTVVIEVGLIGASGIDVNPLHTTDSRDTTTGTVTGNP